MQELMSNENDEIEFPEEWGEIKISELNDDQIEFLLMMMEERRDELEDQIEHYQALENIKQKKNRQTQDHFPHLCRRQGKYRGADVCDHADKERTDSEDVQPDD